MIGYTGPIQCLRFPSVYHSPVLSISSILSHCVLSPDRKIRIFGEIETFPVIPPLLSMFEDVIRESLYVIRMELMEL